MTRFVRNRAFESDLRDDPQTLAFLARQAGKGAAAVREAAPPGGTGYYRKHVRASATQIKLRDPFWHLIEFGSIHNPAYAPLRRGMRAAGFRLDLEPRD